VTKLLLMLEDPACQGIVCWRGDGLAFLVADVKKFEEILPKFFNHKKFTSFVRQIHLYGFHKASNVASGMVEFSNAMFVRGRPDLINQIGRRTKRSNIGSNIHNNHRVSPVPLVVAKPEITISFEGEGSVGDAHFWRHMAEQLQSENTLLTSNNNMLRMQMESCSPPSSVWSVESEGHDISPASPSGFLPDFMEDEVSSVFNVRLDSDLTAEYDNLPMLRRHPSLDGAVLESHHAVPMEFDVDNLWANNAEEFLQPCEEYEGFEPQLFFFDK